MNNKDSEFKFEIRQTTSMPTVANQGIQAPITPQRNNNKEELWVHKERDLRMAIMQSIVIEAKFAHNANAFLLLNSVSIADQASRHLFEILDSERDEALQPFMEKFCQRALEDFATRQFGISEVATANIAYTIHRDHYPPEMEPENKGFWARVLGV